MNWGYYEWELGTEEPATRIESISIGTGGTNRRLEWLSISSPATVRAFVASLGEPGDWPTSEAREPTRGSSGALELRLRCDADALAACRWRTPLF